MKVVILLTVAMLPALAYTQDANTMTEKEKCDVIANFPPEVYQRYLNGQTKKIEYDRVNEATADDLESRSFLKEMVDIVYDLPRLIDKEKIDLLKVAMREKTRSLCLESHLKDG